jgi:hypothetical protein
VIGQSELTITVEIVLSETWEDQYKRMHRSYQRLKRAVDDNIDRDPELHSLEHSRDILYHFCADAYHLKDYIKNTPNQAPAIQRDVELLCSKKTNPNASTALAICGDIANGFKHLDLKTSKFQPGGEAGVTKQEAGIRLPATLPAYFTYHFTIEADGKTYSEIKVADDALADWDAWLTGHSFSLPPLT